MNLKEYILLTIVFALSFCLVRSCENNTTNHKQSDTTTNLQVDTVLQYVKGNPDTIHDTIVKWYKKLVPYYAGDTVTLKGNSVSLYTTIIEDSLLSGKFTSTVVGKILFSDFKYVAKFPKYIYKTDTLKQSINTIKTIVKNPWEFYVGGQLGGNSAQFNLQPAVLVRIPKKRLLLGYGYNVIQKTHNVHVYTKLK